MFENLVKQLVTLTLNNPKVVKEFCQGTLFVASITPAEAVAVCEALETKVGKIIMSPIGDTGEYAYDFV